MNLFKESIGANRLIVISGLDLTYSKKCIFLVLVKWSEMIGPIHFCVTDNLSLLLDFGFSLQIQLQLLFILLL